MRAAGSYEWPPRPRTSQPPSSSDAAVPTFDTSSSNPWDRPTATALNFAGTPTLAQLQQQTEQHATAIRAAEQSMLRMAESAAQTGAATLEQLHVQGEQLRHIRSEQQKIDDNLTTADRLLRGMESWRGAARNALGSLFGDSGARRPVVLAREPIPAAEQAMC